MCVCITYHIFILVSFPPFFFFLINTHFSTLRPATCHSARCLCNAANNPDSNLLHVPDRRNRRSSTASRGSARYTHPVVLNNNCPQDTSRRSMGPAATQSNPECLSRARAGTHRRWTLNSGSVRSTSWKDRVSWAARHWFSLSYFVCNKKNCFFHRWFIRWPGDYWWSVIAKIFNVTFMCLSTLCQHRCKFDIFQYFWNISIIFGRALFG